jgi:hypothetical protein
MWLGGIGKGTIQASPLVHDGSNGHFPVAGFS